MAVQRLQNESDAFCEHCGRPLDEAVHDTCSLDPPRFCTRCGRRLKVQVYPDRYDARCLVCDDRDRTQRARSERDLDA